MNRGSALKWVELLRSCEDLFDNSELGFLGNAGEIYISPIGVLCRFIDPDSFKLDFMNRYISEESLINPNKTVMKRCKIKTQSMWARSYDYSGYKDSKHLTDKQMQDLENNSDHMPKFLTLYDHIDSFTNSTNSPEHSNRYFNLAADFIEANYEEF